MRNPLDRFSVATVFRVALLLMLLGGFLVGFGVGRNHPSDEWARIACIELTDAAGKLVSAPCRGKGP